MTTRSGFVAPLHAIGVPLCCSPDCEVEERRYDRLQGSQVEREIMRWGVRWDVAYPIFYRRLEKMMGERGVTVDYSTLNRWVIKYAPELEKEFIVGSAPWVGIGGSMRRM
jgi:hypothetical protein